MDGDFDVCQRSKDGCVPPLLAMARRGWNNAERESSMVEQEVKTCHDRLFQQVKEVLTEGDSQLRDNIVPLEQYFVFNIFRCAPVGHGCFRRVEQ